MLRDLRTWLALLLLTLLAGLSDAGGPPKQGIMTTRAGTGERGFTGDGGPADKATLSEPFHCDVDGDGNLYIAEATNHCIRKVERVSGKISTVAGTGKKGYSGDGGKATEATFNEPYAVVVNKEND